MRNSLWQWALLLSLLVLVPHAYAQDDAAIQELYVKSGLEKQLAQLPFVIQAALDQTIVTDPHADQLSPQMRSVMKALAPKAFALDTLKTVVLAALKDQLTPDDTRAVLQWLNSPLGAKCTRLEETGSTPAALAEILQYATRAQKSPPTATRLQIIRQLDAALRTSESSVEIAISMQLALALAIRESYPRELQRPVDDVLRDLEATRPSLESVVTSQTLFTLLYTYRSLTDAEIGRYAAFARTPAGAKYGLVTLAALKKAIFECSVKWGKAIGEVLQRSNPQAEA